MKSIEGISLADVTSLYGGTQSEFLQLLYGQQIHIGGMKASIDLAERASISAGLSGVDLCCCNGAGMRFLVRFRNVASMVGVDATESVVERGRSLCREEELDDRIRFLLADACQSGLPTSGADFVWGEDAWCYVVDKPRLIAEAARLVRPGGVIAFTDWVEGPEELRRDRGSTPPQHDEFRQCRGHCGLHSSALGKRVPSASCRRHRPLSFLCRSVSKHDRDAAYL